MKRSVNKKPNFKNLKNCLLHFDRFTDLVASWQAAYAHTNTTVRSRKNRCHIRICKPVYCTFDFIDLACSGWHCCHHCDSFNCPTVKVTISKYPHEHNSWVSFCQNQSECRTYNSTITNDHSKWILLGGDCYLCEGQCALPESK